MAFFPKFGFCSVFGKGFLSIENVVFLKKLT